VLEVRVKGFFCMLLSLTLITLESQDLIGFNLKEDMTRFFGPTKGTLVCLQFFFGLMLVYVFVVVFASLSKVNLGVVIRIKSDKSTFLISILTSLVLYSYVSFSLYYNFGDSVMQLRESHLTKVG